MKIKVKFLFLLILCTACSQTPPLADVAKDNFNLAIRQLNFALSEIEQTKAVLAEERKEKFLIIPRTNEFNDSLCLVASFDWYSGLFSGILWHMYEYTKDEYWRQKAEKFTIPVKQKKEEYTHDMVYKMYCSFGNGYRLTHNTQYKSILIELAETLVARFDSHVGCLRSWDQGVDKWQYPVAIDNMMSLELLFWAYKQTNREEFYDIAVRHAHTTIRTNFRDDYSSYYIIDYDTITGSILKRDDCQGYVHEPVWACGQACGLYGYTMCYRETNLPEFLEQAKHIANYLFNSKTLPKDLIPYWDFNAPEIPDVPRDTAAAAIMACALYELSMYDKERAVKYKLWADTIIENLSRNYCAPLNADRGSLLLHSVSPASCSLEINLPVISADYYFLEALLKKLKLEKEGDAVL